MLDETAQLDKARKALETFIKESENQVHIARECLYNREKRQGKIIVYICKINHNSRGWTRVELSFKELTKQCLFKEILLLLFPDMGSSILNLS